MVSVQVRHCAQRHGGARGLGSLRLALDEPTLSIKLPQLALRASRHREGSAVRDPRSQELDDQVRRGTLRRAGMGHSRSSTPTAQSENIAQPDS
jgi:hypothetical protein